MAERSDTLQKVLVVPATAGCWDDLEALFGKNGARASETQLIMRYYVGGQG